MAYIVFDLEWNQCPYGKSREVRGLPFEIVEIGAVRLNEEKEITGTFHRFIKPAVYKSLHFRTREVINIRMSELKEGQPFMEAAGDFFEFCGEDPIFCTWGPHDLTELQRNLRFYHSDDRMTQPLFFEDVQKLFARTYENGKDQRALSYAAEFLEISQEGEFHRALDDAMYTALVFQRIPDEVIRTRFSVDTFHVPKRRSEEIRIRYPDYEKFISREFCDCEAIMKDREITKICCFVCGKPLRRKLAYFKTGNHVYQGAALCHEHGYVKSKIRIKKTLDEELFAIRTIKMISEERYAELCARKNKKKAAAAEVPAEGGELPVEAGEVTGSAGPADTAAKEADSAEPAVDVG